MAEFELVQGSTPPLGLGCEYIWISGCLLSAQVAALPTAQYCDGYVSTDLQDDYPVFQP